MILQSNVSLRLAVKLSILFAGSVASASFAADITSTSAPPSQLRVVILPFQNLSGDADLDDWCHALPSGVRGRLDTAEFTEVVGTDTMLKAMKRVGADTSKPPDAKLARQVASDLNAAVAVWGGFRRRTNEWTARVSVLRLDTERLPVEIEVAEGNPVELSDSLALRLASVLGKKIADDDREQWKLGRSS